MKTAIRTNDPPKPTLPNTCNRSNHLASSPTTEQASQPQSKPVNHRASQPTTPTKPNRPNKQTRTTHRATQPTTEPAHQPQSKPVNHRASQLIRASQSTTA